ncbi:HEPN/Toprim-associated domain-containing protein [Larkinella punicea]|uniref:HEPN/Toprim N-terminal domain-containing protein n=1 Tax=Larkinella punicea TaxID=2315727 RepID=A0A368JR12_9BACT|nr:HEPN/Toprim-associated domain-containing protein [Larkinella punicea]RCR69406.1 hypothetical protein DUE52_11175 [Larkinella punicea]
MSKYIDLSIGKILIGSFKINFDLDLLSLFDRSDIVQHYSTLEEEGLVEEYSHRAIVNPHLTVFYFKSSLSIIKDRLEIMGYTSEVAKEGFNKSIEYLVSNREYEISKEDFIDTSDQYPISFFTQLTVEKWLDKFKYIAFDRDKYDTINTNHNSNEDLLESYIASRQWFGYPGNDILIFLRLVIDFFDPNDQLIYNFTEYLYDQVDDEYEFIHELEAIASSPKSCIIITEGSSDTWIIQRSLKLLYPDLSRYYKFLKFDESNFSGGAGAIVNLIKAFIGVGINERIIALFDNDTAAEDSLRGIGSINIPENIIISKYPDIKIAKNYPTMGPSGIVNMDINGLAGSIEIYLGNNILQDENGNLTPIMWKGYNSTLKKYQGELIDKNKFHSKIDNQLSLCENNPALIANFDWNDIDMILKQLFTSFHKLDRTIILENLYAD